MIYLCTMLTIFIATAKLENKCKAWKYNYG